MALYIIFFIIILVCFFFPAIRIISNPGYSRTRKRNIDPETGNFETNVLLYDFYREGMTQELISSATEIRKKYFDRVVLSHSTSNSTGAKGYDEIPESVEINL